MSTPPGDPADPRAPKRIDSTTAGRDRVQRLYAWNLPLLVVGFVCAFLFFGRGNPIVTISAPVAVGLGCLLWTLALTPVVRYRSKTGAIACVAIALLAIPLCFMGDAARFVPDDGLHGLLRAFPAGACLSVLALGGLARAGKL